VKRTIIFLLAATMAMTALAVAETAVPAGAAPPANFGTYMLLNDMSGRCLNQDYSGGVKHRDVLAWGCDPGALNERWKLEADPLSPTYYDLVNVKSGECLNQDYSGNVEHSDIITYNCTDDDNSTWLIWYDTGRGKYALANPKSGKCLNQDYSGGTMHTDVIAYKCQPVTDDSISNQFWWIESV
jgi:hypothetical protein